MAARVLMAGVLAAFVTIAASGASAVGRGRLTDAVAACPERVGPGIPPPAAVLAGIPGFHASWYGQSGYVTLCPGGRTTATIAFYNSGSLGWVQGRPGETAYLGITGWPGAAGAVVQPAAYVGPGQVAWFQFTIQAPMTPGTYRLALRPSIGGSLFMEDEGVFWIVTVRDAPAPMGLRDPIAFAAACPTADPAYPLMADDVAILVDGAPAAPPPCAVDDARTRTLQALLLAYHMERGRAVAYPWTSLPLYDWMRTRLSGFDIRSDTDTSWCCETLAHGSYAVLAKQALLERSWSGIASWLALMAHEVRHNGGPGHVDCVSPPISGGCDAIYDEANISSYGIQYWLNRAWLSGDLNVGLGCLPAAERFGLATLHLRNTDRFRARFVGGRPPEVPMPQAAGGPCPPP